MKAYIWCKPQSIRLGVYVGRRAQGSAPQVSALALPRWSNYREHYILTIDMFVTRSRCAEPDRVSDFCKTR